MGKAVREAGNLFAPGTNVGHTNFLSSPQLVKHSVLYFSHFPRKTKPRSTPIDQTNEAWGQFEEEEKNTLIRFVCYS